jgi:hypothetical protein
MRHPRAVAPCSRTDQNGDPLTVVSGELLNDAEGKCIVSADDQMISNVIKAPRNRGHCVI